jgi:hypothetical protein
MSRRETRVLIGVPALCLIGLGVRTMSPVAMVGVLVGAVISGAIPFYFYRRATRDLIDAAEELREATERVLRILQTISGGGKARPIWDERGRSKGVEHEIEIGGISSDSSVFAQPKIHSAEDRPQVSTWQPPEQV